MAKTFKIRRNLKKGAEYGFMQVSVSDTNSKLGATVEMINPDTHSIEMYGCKLWNVKGTAEKILNGAYKERCAWVVCDSYEVVEAVSPISEDELSYNPRMASNWLDNDLNDVDKNSYDVIVTSGVKLFHL